MRVAVTGANGAVGRAILRAAPSLELVAVVRSERARATKLIFVSATGADPRSTNRYWRTKAEAEAVVRASGLSHTVLRVPMLLGRGTEAATALRHRLGQRTIPLLRGGRTLQQPL